MATIYSLPAPLPLHIAKLAPDLKALDALRQSCGLFAAIFDQHAVELLEYVMLHTLEPGVVMEIRMHALCFTNGDLWRERNNALDQLRKQAAAPLQSDTPVKAVTKALRTFSCLHSLCFRVATEKLDELYALPHRHPTHPPGIDYRHHTGEPYEVPKPSKPSWLEEQILMRSLLHLRNRGLLGRGLVAPVASPESPFFTHFFDRVHEVQRFFEPYLQATTTGPIFPVVDWQAAPTAPSPGLIPGNYSLSALLQNGLGWEIFHSPTRLLSGTPLVKEDWPVFQELGLGIWSDERLADELQLLDVNTWTFTWWALCKTRLLERRASKVDLPE
ncbi:hypothetical protein LTR56_006001 [Elasticomyces elasticus]|nr:hypothetical protein LTR56_006001 [Elasticomyces elasticus]KAK3669038.1 hypothetical protein LTR22_000117 [Elasticomyces elasticus]KAK4922663.1 hypothetical protein LTR49_010019 [Elasticomyces elasticus]KAK5760918.1 hypothetical protein LTS12_008922 [Elasticomyces elasticus]